MMDGKNERLIPFCVERGKKMSKFNWKFTDYRKKRRKGTIFLSLFAFIAIVAAIGFFSIYQSLRPVDKEDRTPVKVTIPHGSSIAKIGEILEDKGIIRNQQTFKYYIKWKKKTGFQAGTYYFSPSMSLDEIIRDLQKGNSYENASIVFTIPEGRQLREIAKTISKHSPYDFNTVWNRLNDRVYIQQLIKKYPNLLSKDILNPKVKYPLEGYLYPAVYAYYDPNTPLDTIIEDMVAKTDRVLSQYQKAMKVKKITPHKLLTMASLVEEEATEKADRRKIASIFYNRLAKKMPLQTDPTVLYALNKHKSRVVYKDLQVNSPYNTYKYKGLPPGPISNSGISSIEAALNPEKTDFLYFLAAPSGDVYYAKTLDEHNRLKQKFITQYYKTEKK
jgi:UPF0755 protein